MTEHLETRFPARHVGDLELSPLTPEDGAALHRLVGLCPPLDGNSLYCNLLQCAHFGATSMAARRHGELLGSVTGHRLPDRPDTLFVWQVAVHPAARGQSLGRRLLGTLVAQPALADIRFIETTITPDNQASWRLFEGFATEHAADQQRSVMFDRERHFGGRHETEHLLRIGPLKP